jgi:hypothetical protein
MTRIIVGQFYEQGDSMNKVIDGTREERATTLCESCRAATCVKGRSFREDRTFCGQMAVWVLHKVTACSRFDDKSQPSRWDFEQIAWILTTQRDRNKIGFVSPAEYQKLQQGQPPYSGPKPV